MRKPKVYGGSIFVKGIQHRAIIAGTQQQIADATHQSLHYIRGYWGETGNDVELKLALSCPGTLFVTSMSRGKKTAADYQQVVFDSRSMT